MEAWALGLEGTYLIEQLVNYLKGKEQQLHRANRMGRGSGGTW